MSPWFVAVVIALAVLFACMAFYRLRRGGPGPSMRWVPRSRRQDVNRRYEERGWQKPYDEDGNWNKHRKLF